MTFTTVISGFHLVVQGPKYNPTDLLRSVRVFSQLFNSNNNKIKKTTCILDVL